MINLAIIGTGGMANSHAGGFKKIKACKLVACCDIVPGRAKAFAEKHGIPSFYEDAGEMFSKEKLDGVSVVTIDRAHAAPALLAIEHGVHVMCEKPLSDNLRDAQRMEAAAKKKGVLTAVNFTYRNSTATQKAAELVAQGKLGRVMHVEGSYLQSWLANKVWGDWRTGEAWLWRLSAKHGSLGVMGDVGVHLYDLASFVVGDFAELSCVLKTFDKGVKKIGKYVLDANDSMLTTVRFRNGAMGALHATRWASGQTNTVALRVYGEKGSLDLNLDRPEGEQLRVSLGKDAEKNQWKAAVCPKTPNMYDRFITAIRTKRQGQTSFAGGLKVQTYLERSFASAKSGGKFVKV